MTDNKNKIKKILPYIIILIVAIILTIPLIFENARIIKDDGVHHVVRLIEQFESIKQGHFFGEVYQRLCNGFGYSWNLFYSPLTSIVPIIFVLITNSFYWVLRLFLLLMLFLSGIAMYEFIKRMTNKKTIGVLTAVLYMVAPYHLTDMYTRFALAEFSSFVFLPLVFLGLHNIFYEQKRGIWLIIGTSGLLLTHTVITAITAIFAFVYILLHIKQAINKTIIKELIISLAFVIAITSFFTFPLLEHKQKVEYEVFQPNRMGTIESYENSKIDLKQLFITIDSSFVFEIGIVTIVGLVLTPIAWKKIDKKIKKEYIFFLVCGIISILLTLKIIPINLFGRFSTFIQFAWRFLEFSSFFFSIVAAINFGNIIVNFRYRDVIVLSILAVICLFPLLKYIDKDNSVKEEELLETVPVTENTGIVHPGCAKFEYLPTKAFENRNYIEKRQDVILVQEGQAEILQYEKQGQELTAYIQTNNNKAKIELPYIYYLGYEVTLQENGQTENLNTFETEYGFLGAQIPENTNGILQVSYTGTTLMKVTKMISLIAIIIFIVLVVKRKIDKK